jgi:hypothetical protein
LASTLGTGSAALGKINSELQNEGLSQSSGLELMSAKNDNTGVIVSAKNNNTGVIVGMHCCLF